MGKSEIMVRSGFPLGQLLLAGLGAAVAYSNGFGPVGIVGGAIFGAAIPTIGLLVVAAGAMTLALLLAGFHALYGRGR
jgi:hypothetical protein